jgi:hypothetical protein
VPIEEEEEVENNVFHNYPTNTTVVKYPDFLLKFKFKVCVPSQVTIV